MSFSVGIIGLPNVGKSTLFNALTQDRVDISNYPFCTIEPNVGVVEVPDEQLEKIAQVIKPEKVTPTVIEFVDIAGLVKQAHEGEGLGNQFLANIRECDAILEVVRAFPSEKIKHVEDEVNPQKDIEIINTELIMKDLQTIEKALEDHPEKELLLHLEESLNQEKLITSLGLNEDEQQAIKEFQFLTAKPIVYVLNINDKTSELIDSEVKEKNSHLKQLLDSNLTLNVKMEQEIADLDQQEKEELKVESHLDKLITQCYNSLDLITFYTITGGEETRAWTLERGKTCPEAGGVVHSDFQENFIKAEVVNSQELIEAGSWKNAKQKGLIRTVGKDYVVQDQDIIKFKI